MAAFSRRVLSYAALAAMALCAGAQTKSGPAHQEKFFGKWTFDRAASQLKHANDMPALAWRSYAADGDRVKVSWGNGTNILGGYSARCDGNIEPSSPGKIRCREVQPNTIDGEQLNNNDKVHRFYRRTVSEDGRTLTITWFSDAKRTKPIDRFVYRKD